MNFEAKIYILCGHPRCGKTSFAHLINLHKKNYINTALESLLRSNNSRYIIGEENKKKELINYFYSKRFEGNNRDRKYALADYLDKAVLNELIKNFKTPNINFSQIIIDMLLKYSSFLKKDLILLDLYSEFYIKKFFKKNKITLLFFTRNYKEMINEVLRFRSVSHYNSNILLLAERTYIIYYISNRYIKKISKNYDINVKIVNFNHFTNQEHNNVMEKEFNLNAGLIKKYYDNFNNENYKLENFKLNEKINFFDKIENSKISLNLIIKHPIFFLKFSSIILFYSIFPKHTLSYITLVYNPFKFIKNIFNQMKLLIRDNF